MRPALLLGDEQDAMDSLDVVENPFVIAVITMLVVLFAHHREAEARTATKVATKACLQVRVTLDEGLELR
jgi:hypothetical protein